MSKIERIDKIIARQGRLSRNDVKALIRAKSIYCNGKLVTSPAQKINIDKDKITIDGQAYPINMFAYLMLNKPKNVISSTEKGKVTTVIDLVPEDLYRKNLFPAGRLDKDSTGFVLLTDDGAFAHSILSPKNHVPKTYEVVIEKKLSDEDIKRVEEGLVVGSTEFLPAKIELLESVLKGYKYQIILNEGKYHQIKRMIASLGQEVLSLHRTKIGGLGLDLNLKPGSCRAISEAELAKIRQL